jgi:signal transduction histidine kinase
MRSATSRDEISGSRRVVVLLALAVVVLGVLAVQAHRALRAHRDTTERILRDYAGLAASSYVVRIEPELEYYAFAPAIAAIADTLEATGRLAEPRTIDVWTDDTTHLAIDLVRTNIVVPLGESAERETRREETAPEAALRMSGTMPDPEFARWLTDTLAAFARGEWRDEWPSAVIVGRPGDGRESDGVASAPRVVVCAVRSGGSANGPAVVAFEAKPSGLDVYFDFALNIRPLLPRALTRGTPQDSLVSIAVLTPGGAPLFRSERTYDSRYVAEETLAARFGGLRVRAALHPATAHVLLFEGPPRAQPFALAALALLAAALLAAALLVVRRDAELARARADFIASVSHELRTPLAQIRLFAETLLLGRVRSEAERRRSLEIIDQEAGRLGDLVDNVLDVTRGARSLPALAPEPTDLGALLEEIAERFAPLAAARGATIARELAPGVSARVDRDATRRMINNLLDNAVKYGPPGQTVRLRLERADSKARISVEDEGPGVAERDRSRIWERFVRANLGATPGAGIGLAVVREIAERHDGRAWVEDAPCGGARFVVSLPAAALVGENEPNANAQPRTPAPRSAVAGD